ncbi:unnamed protein product [Mytilus edulis]|uniref:DUF5641 domain-containing protein n=1 Tax=Mytilus edulis TaxID=6550 RepID=A0A8S3PM48_MYTED|nr:unnamed protein product [Mytilus edulis]
MQGPSWISDENSWPTWTPQIKQETLLLTTTDDSEKIKPCVLNGISKIIDLSRFSLLKKLLRVTCYVFKFVNICKSKRPYNLRKYARHGKDITKDEIDRATRTWITDIQNEKFSNEKQQLANPSHDKNLPLGRRLSQDNNSDSEDNNFILDFTEANKRFNHKVTLIEHFAKRWRMEYLTGLREFHRVAGDQSAHVKIGSVVQIMDNSPRMMWKLAVIEDLITGKDGVVRAVKLRTPNGLITTRPIVKLVPLEI